MGNLRRHKASAAGNGDENPYIVIKQTGKRGGFI